MKFTFDPEKQLPVVTEDLSRSITYERGKKALQHVRLLINTIEGAFNNDESLFCEQELEEVREAIRDLGMEKDYASFMRGIAMHLEKMPWETGVNDMSERAKRSLREFEPENTQND